MKRDIISQLTIWKEDPKHKPLLIRGARQVGKSWVVREFASRFDNFVEINFEVNTEISQLFATNLDPEVLIPLLENYLNKEIRKDNTLLFFDEVQICPQAIVAMRYLYEKMPSIYVIAAGSLLEFELQHISIPVGRIQFLYLYPLSFGEYLTAISKESLRNYILNININEPIPIPIHTQLLQDVRDYTLIGGMPEVVQKYIESKNLNQCQQIQSTLLETFRSDFTKYARKHQIKYLRLLFESIPGQIGNKFKYSNISPDYKTRELSPALDLLEMAGLIYKVFHTSANGVPLGAEVDLSKFKVLFFDIGLFNRILSLDLSELFLNIDIGFVHRGILAELFVGLQLITKHNPYEKAQLYYWHREQRSSNAEVDYIINLGSSIIPIEVKSGTTGRLNSINVFLNEKKINQGIRISAQPCNVGTPITNYPFYMMDKLGGVNI